MPGLNPAMSIFRALFLVCALHSVVTLLVSAQKSTKKASSWQTLNGNEPLVIARGGFSGLFPDSSSDAYSIAVLLSSPNVVLWCDVQLTKDGVGICFPDLKLQNSSSIADFSPNTSSTYLVNGVSTEGWFTVDYAMDFLQNVFLTQAVYSRTQKFDGNMYLIQAVEDVVSPSEPSSLWLDVQHNLFFTQHNLSMRSYVLSVSKRVIVNYVSSPEVGFLRSIAVRFKKTKTKLVFRFLEAGDTEPSTNQTYGSLLKNLTFIKTFASGILVPKSYIWPVTDQYILPHTSVVLDAHKQGLEVYASDFANDASISYNYSYNPISEYLSFVDNDNFSVDGVLSDFPVTASAAIGCFAHMDNNSSGQETPEVISHNGASGMFPGCTDLAYNQAIADGANYIDCPVQMTKDGVPVCLSSINLIEGTTVTQSAFGSLSVIVPEIQKNAGIFSFNLTWEEIKTLKPVISNPSFDYGGLVRNPANKNAGSFVSLADFLALSKPLSGVLISIEHAAYLAEKQGLDITNAVIDVLNKSGYKNQTAQEVIIQSTNKAVLTVFKAQSRYKRMYMVDEDISSIDDSSIKDIKSFADSVAISKESIFPSEEFFLTGSTKVVARLHSFNLSVYAYLFRNEFVSQAWDFFADPIMEINSYVLGGEIDGVITDFPATAASYKKSQCLKAKELPPYMRAAQPGGLLQLITTPSYLPPAEAPNPTLTEADVSEPPLPPVSKQAGSGTNASSGGPTPSKSNAHIEKMAGCFFSSLSMFFASLLLM